MSDYPPVTQLYPLPAYAFEPPSRPIAELSAADIRMAPVIDYPTLLQKNTVPYTLANGRIVCNEDLRHISVDGSDIHLSKNHSRILGLLAANADYVLTHKVLLWGVWGPTYIHDDFTNLKAHINTLRRRLGEELGDRPRGVIRSCKGVGYIALSGRPLGPSCPQN